MARKKGSIIGEIAEFDYHGAWGDFTSPRSVKEFLNSLGENDVGEIEINSPGGLVVQGIEIANAIKNCKAKVVARVTGIAASMASVIACACDEIELEEASFLMIHDPWGYMAGNAAEMRKEANILDQMKSVCMSFYRGAFKGKTEEELSALMSEETWYTANECRENGLACTVISSDYRAAASIVEYHFEKIPEGAAKFLASKDLTAEGKAEIEAARAAAAQANAAAPTTSAPSASADSPAKSATELPAQASTQAQPTANKENVSSAENVITSSADWEARYKGASKKINELQALLEKATVETVDYGAVTKERDQLREEIAGLKAQLDAAQKASASSAETLASRDQQLKQFEDQVKASGYENLAALVGAVSGLKADLEKSGKDLADTREQLDHMRETRDLLTGSVLSPGGKTRYSSFAAAVDALGFVEACRGYPELRASYRKHK